MRSAHALMALLALPASLASQLVRSLPSGVQTFQALGMYEGQPMAPWRVDLEVRDTLLNGRPGIHFVQTTRRPEIQAMFTATATWATSTPNRMDVWYDNAGRAPTQCRMRIGDSTVTATITGGLDPAREATPVSLTTGGAADFAIGVLLASRQHADGDTIRLSAVRCLPSFGKAAIRVFPFVGVVRSEPTPRVVGDTAEAAWVIEGSAQYHLVAKIAKRDRQLISFTLPEGSVGEQTIQFAGGRRE
jgi:hypothetical protein